MALLSFQRSKITACTTCAATPLPHAVRRWGCRNQAPCRSRASNTFTVQPHEALSAPHKACTVVRRAAAAELPSAKSATAEPVVEEVMNPQPVLLRDTESIKEAVHKMLQADVSGCPVVDDAGHLVGVLSESDLIWKGAGAPQDHFIIPPIFIGFADAFIYLRDEKLFEEEVHKILAKTVADAMSRQVLSVKPELPMSAAAQVMLQKQVNLLPVEQDGKVVGVLTRHDVLRGIYASKSPFL